MFFLSLFFGGGCNLTFHIPLCSKQRRKGCGERRKKGSERGWGPFWTLSKLRRLPRSRVSSSFFYQGLPARPLWQFNPLPIYKPPHQKKKKKQRERRIEGAGVWQKKRKKDERAAEWMLSSRCLPHADTGVFCNDFTGFLLRAAVIQRASSGETGVALKRSETLDVDFFEFLFGLATPQPCQREENGSGTGIQVY